MLPPFFTHYTTSIWMDCIQFLISFLSEYIHYNTYAAVKRERQMAIEYCMAKPGLTMQAGKSTQKEVLVHQRLSFSTPCVHFPSVMGVSAEPGQKGVNWSNIAVGE